MSKFLNKEVIVSKKRDTQFDGQHPNQINEGYTFSGILSDFQVGSSCRIQDHYRWFRTSLITAIDEKKGEFTTYNSVYTIKLRTKKKKNEQKTSKHGE